MTIDRVKRGDPPRAAEQNELIDEHNRMLTDGEPPGPQAVYIALFELTSDFNYPDTGTASTSVIDTEPTPWATAKQLWCNQFSTGDVDGSGNAMRSYKGKVSSPEEKIWDVSAKPNADGYVEDQNPGASGDRVLGWFDRQAGRWVMLLLSAIFGIKLGKLDNTLSDGSSTPMTVWSGDPLTATSETLTVWDWFLPSGDEYASGIKVVVLKIVGKWYVINAACD